MGGKPPQVQRYRHVFERGEVVCKLVCHGWRCECVFCTFGPCEIYGNKVCLQKQPWELGFMKPPKPFGDILVPARGCEDVSGHMLAAKRKQQELDSSAEGGLTSFGRQFPKILKQPKFSTWTAKIDYDRRAAFIKWQKILETCIIDFQVGSQIKAARFVKRTFGWNAYFEDVFAVKSTATLHSRANPIQVFEVVQVATIHWYSFFRGGGI